MRGLSLCRKSIEKAFFSYGSGIPKRTHIRVQIVLYNNYQLNATDY